MRVVFAEIPPFADMNEGGAMAEEEALERERREIVRAVEIVSGDCSVVERSCAGCRNAVEL